MPEELGIDQLPPEGKRRLLLIVHGKSAGDLELREAVEELREAGISIAVRVTWEVGDASRYAKEAVEESYDVAVAVGGDGTLNEVVNGILEADPHPQIAAAVVPLGTANDFATSCGLVDHTPVSCLKLAASGPIQPIDIGRVNGQYFINVVSGGFGAEVTASTPQEMKQVLGGAAYSVMGFITALNFRPYQAHLTIDGKPQEETLLMLAVGNGRQCGGGYQLTPKAFLDDGLLDVVIAHDAGFAQWGAVYQELANPDVDQHEFVDFYRVKSFLIKTDEPFQMNLDGEPRRETHFEFDVCEKRLPFVLPKGCPLLAGSTEPTPHTDPTPNS